LSIDAVEISDQLSKNLDDPKNFTITFLIKTIALRMH